VISTRCNDVEDCARVTCEAIIAPVPQSVVIKARATAVFLNLCVSVLMCSPDLFLSRKSLGDLPMARNWQQASLSFPASSAPTKFLHN
jgi:hypothetical protein